MAKDNQASQSSGRQQTSEMAQSGSTSAQQGANPRAGGQQTGWQSPDRNEQSTGGALQQRRGSQQFPSSYYGGPFSVMRRISEDMDRLFDAFGFGRGLFPTLGESSLSGYGGQGGSSLWAPHIEVSEREGKFLVSADLPGVKRTAQAREDEQRRRFLPQRAQLRQLLSHDPVAGRRQYREGVGNVPRRRVAGRDRRAAEETERPDAGDQGRGTDPELERRGATDGRGQVAAATLAPRLGSR